MLYEVITTQFTKQLDSLLVQENGVEVGTGILVETEGDIGEAEDRPDLRVTLTLV